jgi:hypothetical protein
VSSTTPDPAQRSGRLLLALGHNGFGRFAQRQRLPVVGCHQQLALKFRQVAPGTGHQLEADEFGNRTQPVRLEDVEASSFQNVADVILAAH